MSETQALSAVLIDTVSIQQYIFGSNKLKENIGASWIIENHLYKELFLKTIEEEFKIQEFDITYWTKQDAPLLYPNSKIGIGYIGGGNALVLFQGKETAESFLKTFSLNAFLHFPGIRIAAGIIDDFYPSGVPFCKSMQRLNLNLRKCKNLGYVHTHPFKSGIVDDCPASGEAMEFKAIDRWVSGEIQAKLDCASQSHAELAKNILLDNQRKYSFPEELENLGQLEDKGYISVVHFDGNGIGKKFAETTDLKTLRDLSAKVSQLGLVTMQTICLSLIKEIEKKTQYNNENKEEDSIKIKFGTQELQLQKKGGKITLPIRPLLIGGDDITFVCEGRLGLHLAEKIILAFYTKSKEILDQHFHGCAGVAIAKTKYPFYQTYQLSEELLKEAKTSSRNSDPKKVTGSFLSFLISSSGTKGSLEQMNETVYKTESGKLRNGPYCVILEKGEETQQPTFDSLKKHVGYFHTWPQSALIGMRNVLRESETEQKAFMLSQEFRDRKFPDTIKGLYENKKSAIYDVAECSEFLTLINE